MAFKKALKTKFPALKTACFCFKKAFKQVNVLASPTMPITAPTFGEISKLSALQNYMMDIMTVGPNLAGLPHITVPVGFNKDKMPIGLMLIAEWKNPLPEKSISTILASRTFLIIMIVTIILKIPEINKT